MGDQQTPTATTRPGRPALQRVPPHDTRTEEALLGAALLTAAAARIVATIGPDPFYNPGNQIIADTVTNLVTAGHPTDTGTVAAHITRNGQADSIGGIYRLIELQTDCPSTTSAAHWADLLVGYWHKRRILTAAAEVVEAVYQGLPTGGLVAGMHTLATQQALGAAGSWEPVNLAAILAGEVPELLPTVWARSDGQPLLYPGKTHAINAEPEAGKSFCAQAASAQEIQAGRHVLYIDFEADAADVTERMLELGCTPAQILEHFHYIRPDDPIDAQALLKAVAACETWHPTLAVLDGVTEALAGAGWSINDNDDIAQFYKALPRPLARQGCAVLMIDHVVKDPDTRGRYGIGGIHKMAGVDGITYTLESLTPFSKNNAGSSRLICTKDRHGQVRPHCKDQKLAAVIHFKPLPGGHGIDVTADPYDQAGGDREPFRPTGTMERISRQLAHGPALTVEQIKGACRAKSEVVALALRLLVADGYVAAAKQGGSTYHSNIRPYPETVPEPESEPTDEAF